MGSVIVATTKGYVRFFSSSGIQRYLWRVGEEVVSMTAGKEAVMLVHREGGTSLDGKLFLVCGTWLMIRMSEFEVFDYRSGILRDCPRGKSTLTPEGVTFLDRIQSRWSKSPPTLAESAGLTSRYPQCTIPPASYRS